jgi:hypothetical protein
VVLQPLGTKAAPIPCVENCTLQQSADAANESLGAACNWADSAANAYSNGVPSLAVADADEAVQTAANASEAAKDASFLAGRSGTPAAWAQAAAAALAAAEAWADAAAAMMAAGQPSNSAAITNAWQQAEDMAALASEDASFAADDQTTAYATQAAQVGQAINTWRATGKTDSDTACIYGG